MQGSSNDLGESIINSRLVHLQNLYHLGSIYGTQVCFQDSRDWPIIDPLPSYGRGRELPGKRHQSLIYGYNLTDVIITGWPCFHKIHLKEACN